MPTAHPGGMRPRTLMLSQGSMFMSLEVGMACCLTASLQSTFSCLSISYSRRVQG